MTGLLDLADELYAVPLAEFTPARDARAKELKGTPLAAEVKALRKPSTAAWLVDLLVRREPAQVDQLLAVGAALREAQQAMSAGELRALTKQRRQVTAAVVQHLRQVAATEGHRITEAVALQVEETLTAAMVDAECGRAVRSGLLVAPLRTTGLEPLAPEVVAAAVAVPEALGFTAAPREAPERPRPELHLVPDPDKEAKAIAAAEERLAGATSAYEEAAEAHAATVTEVERLTARSLQIQAELDELRRRLAGLEEESESLDEEIGDAEDERDEAAAALRTAAADRDQAQAALDRVTAAGSGG